MKKINNYILEKLKINKDIKISSSHKEKVSKLIEYLSDELILSKYEYSKDIMWCVHHNDTDSINIGIHKDAKRKECESIYKHIIWMLESTKFCDNPKDDTVFFNKDTYEIDINLSDIIN